MKIKYKDKDLLESQDFITFGPEVTNIEINYNNEKLYLKLEFLDDPEPNRPLIALIPESKDIAKLVLKNFDFPFGNSFKEPLKVGDIGGREIFIIITARPLGKDSKMKEVHISTYLGAEVNHG